MIKINKTWETVYFTATKSKKPKEGEISATIELTYNHQTKNFNLSTEHEEGVSFKNDSVEQAELRAEAVVAAVKYLRKIK